MIWLSIVVEVTEDCGLTREDAKLFSLFVYWFELLTLLREKKEERKK